MDVSDLPALSRLLEGSDFDILVNGTGMTSVDECEVARSEADLVNVKAPELMARIAAKKGARFIHISTDYVFEGTKDGLYTEEDPAHPISHYGRTKLEGEKVALAASPRHLTVRISWVFGPDKPSFIDMIIDRALSNTHVEAVANKTSSPTYAEDVAHWLEPFITSDLPGGLFQACNSGVCTWRDYGQYALDCAAESGLPLKTQIVHPITLSDLKNFAALRPPHTAMSTAKLAATTGITPRPWQDALKEYLKNKFSNASILPSSN